MLRGNKSTKTSLSSSDHDGSNSITPGNSRWKKIKVISMTLTLLTISQTMFVGRLSHDLAAAGVSTFQWDIQSNGTDEKNDPSLNADTAINATMNATSHEETNDYSSEFSCKWSPESPESCDALLTTRLPLTIIPSAKSDNNTIMATTTTIKRQRWLFFGDSTMLRPFLFSTTFRNVLVYDPLQNIKSKNPCWSSIQCEERESKRCEHARLFNVEPISNWEKPNFELFVGPVDFAVKKPYCSDCRACDPHFLHCVPVTMNAKTDIVAAVDHPQGEQCNETKLTYGGVIVNEFTKDVEIQSALYNTSQENIAWYLREYFNMPQLVMEWGKPICVAGNGFHDMILLHRTDNYNLEHFLENVEWYLMLLSDVCSHIIWLANTAPTKLPEDQKDAWTQTYERTEEWNEAVKLLIEKNPVLLRMSTYVDPFEGSIGKPHMDRIHLEESWYKDVGDWFSKFMVET